MPVVCSLNKETKLKKPIFIAQIENIEGIENVESIIEIPEVDMIFVGPSDLNKNLRAYANNTSISFEKAIKIVAEAAKKHKKQSGILVQNNTDIPGLIDLGYTFLGLSSDIKVLSKGFNIILNEIKV